MAVDDDGDSPDLVGSQQLEAFINGQLFVDSGQHRASLQPFTPGLSARSGWLACAQVDRGMWLANVGPSTLCRPDRMHDSGLRARTKETDHACRRSREFSVRHWR